MRLGVPFTETTLTVQKFRRLAVQNIERQNRGMVENMTGTVCTLYSSLKFAKASLNGFVVTHLGDSILDLLKLTFICI